MTLRGEMPLRGRIGHALLPLSGRFESSSIATSDLSPRLLKELRVKTSPSNWTLQTDVENGLCEPLEKLGFLGQWKLGLAGQHRNWALQASMGNSFESYCGNWDFSANVESGPCGSAWELGFTSQYGKWALRAIVEIGISQPMWNLGLAGQHGS
ncbi:hypothetical protein LR48_Vigan04g091400 [Vigna angularis]|uniref:Uncharacterized protein n=1 Tax=Phaseolus angularis TaxID=3914 RepID=A0A0L9UDC6_PHAAN|nr:hypothetical protein LR48_Vigan04g091400 [Vigna angularis]